MKVNEPDLWTNQFLKTDPSINLYCKLIINMDSTNNEYDYKEVSNLIWKNELDKAFEYMRNYMENKPYQSLHYKLLGCRNRLKRVVDSRHTGIIKFETYNTEYNKIVHHLIYLNNEIKNEDNAARKKKFYAKIKALVGFLLFSITFLFTYFCLTKTIIPYNKNFEFSSEPPYHISELFIAHAACFDSTFVSFNIENISNHNLDSLQFTWTPNKSTSISEKSKLINLKVREVKTIHIPIKLPIKFEPGVYNSSLKEIHPVSVNRKFGQNFKVMPCRE